MIALMVLGCMIYVTATENINSRKSKGEVLLFQRSRAPKTRRKYDLEASSDDRIDAQTTMVMKQSDDVPASIEQHTSIVHWENVNFDLEIKKERRRILEAVDGWVRAGTLTALMVKCSNWLLEPNAQILLRALLAQARQHSSTC